MAEGEGGGRGAGGYNHGPGSFAHNNADRLPGQSLPASTRNAPPLRPAFTAAQDGVAGYQHDTPQGQSEASRQAAFNASRRNHAPLAVPVLRPSDARAEAVDRASFKARQNGVQRDHARTTRAEFRKERSDPPQGPTKGRGR